MNELFGEVLYDGPLDRTRRVNREAEALDAIVDSMIALDPDNNLEKYKAQAVSLDRLSPIFGQQVEAYGDQLTLAYDEAGEETDHVIIRCQRDDPPTEGVYKGFGLYLSFDPQSEENVYRVAHMIDLGHQTVTNKYDTMSTHAFFSLVCVTGSEVRPVEPVNAHSMEDLEGDEVAATIKELTSTGGELSDSRFRQLCEFMNDVLRRADRYDPLTFQRLSYLNSTKILNGIDVVTNDLVIASSSGAAKNLAPKSLFTKDSTISSLGSLVRVTPRIFEATEGYSRVSEGEIARQKEPELFIHGALKDGRDAFVPTKSIQAVKQNA